MSDRPRKFASGLADIGRKCKPVLKTPMRIKPLGLAAVKAETCDVIYNSRGTAITMLRRWA